jgi:caspase domain-containing protein
MSGFSKLKAWCVSSVISLGVAVLLFGLAGSRSYAQQEPNRQLVQTNTSHQANARRIALVIGNGGYTNAPPLKNPPNDARDMAATLKALGFEVTSGINVNQREMKRLMREFGQKLKTGGSGLFYYAGHGVQSKGRNYLIPVEADIQSEIEAEDAGVDVSLVLGYMDDAQNGLNIVILDACRNNPFTKSFRSAGSGLAQVDAPTGTLIAYATSPGRVASDGQGRNGLYTSELLNQMLVSGISVEEMFKRVRASVQRQTSGQQVPWESSSLIGNFYFATPVGPNNNADTGTRVALDPASFELSYWETIKNSADANDFKGYLEKYPSGQFVTLAKNRVASIEAASKPVESRSSSSNGAAELAFWDAIKNSTSADDFRDYLEKYPNGEFAVLAKRRLEPLEATEKEKAKGEGIARNIAGMWKYGDYGNLAMMDGGTCRWKDNDQYQCTWAFTDTDHRVIKFTWNTGTGVGSVMTLSADGQRLAGTDSRGMPMIFTRIGGLPAAAANNSANESSPIDLNAKIFPGYMGVMSAGFTARPGKLVIAAAGMQFIWDGGIPGIAEGRTDGLTGSKPVIYLIHPDPAPTPLQCSYFTAARSDGFFIREINFNDGGAAMLNVGIGGAVARFRASSPAEAITVLAAVREFCNKRP